jgi:hypothetical protein
LIQQGLGDLAAIVAAHGVWFPSYRAKFQGKREVRRVGMADFRSGMLRIQATRRNHGGGAPNLKKKM